LAQNGFYHNEEEQNPKVYDIGLIKRLLSYARRYWLLFAVALVMLLGSSASQLVRPYLVKIAIDDYLNGYTKPMISCTKSTGGEEILFEGTYYVRVDTVPSDIPDSRIFCIVNLDGEPYLVNGPVEQSSGTEASVIPSVEEKGLYNHIFTQDGRSYPARKLTPSELGVFRSGDMDSIAKIGLIFIIIILSGFAFNFLEVYLLSYAGQNIIFNIRQEVFEHLQKMSMSFFDNTPVGRLVTRVSNDTEALNEMYTNVIVNLIRDMFIILGVMVIMLRMDLTLFFIAIAVMPLILLLTILFRLKIRPVYRKSRENLARINSALSENISGMRIIQIFNRERENYKEFEKINREYYNTGIKEIVIGGIFRPVVQFVSTLATALLLWFGGGKVIEGVIEFGVLYAFIQYIEYLFHPIDDLSEKYNILQSAMAASERIFSILDTPAEQDEGTEEFETSCENTDIEFKNVWFAYNQDDWVLKDVSFTVPSGKTVAIVGATGAGKTSIINLLNRFYEVQKGEITIGNTDIRRIKKSSLRRNIGVVLQDVFIFSGSVKDNIRLNEYGMDDEHIRKAAQYVNAEYFINKLPDGYDSEVNERGSTFSSGERQLLAFARAIAFNPRILILDEATSNIDTETEILIQEALKKLTKNRTTIIIAHRLSTIQHADKIIVLHKGRIKEMGTHNELLKKEGMYYNLYRLQYKD